MAKTQQGRQEHGFSRLNSYYAVVLVLLALVSAVPLASNRPSWWLLWTALISFLGVIYQLSAWRMIPGRPARIRPLLGYFLLAAVVPAYAMLQAQNIAGLLPTWLISMRPGMEALAGRTISVVPDASLIGALRYLGYLILLALVIEVSTRRERVGMMSRILFTGITLQAVWALVALKLLGDVSLFGEKTAYLGMATGTFINRNSLATFLGFGLVLGAVLIGRRFEGPETRTARRRGLIEKLGTEGQLVLVAMLIILLALLATQSRLGLAASMIGLGVATLLLLWRQGRLSVRLLLGILLGLIFVGVVVALVGAGISDRALFSKVDSATRLNLYRQILGMIAQRPWTGFGLDGFGPAFEAFRAPPLNDGVAFDLAHNSYLALWSELGLVVGSITPLLLLTAAVLLLRRLRQGADFPSNAAGSIGVLVLGAVHSLGDFSLEIPANNYVLLVILGMGLARRTPPTQSSQTPATAAVVAGANAGTATPLPKPKDDPA